MCANTYIWEITHAWLLQIVRSLQPNILDTLGERYTSAVNTLLRKELRLYTSELRKMVAAAAAQLPAEPVILKGSRKVRNAGREKGIQNEVCYISPSCFFRVWFTAHTHFCLLGFIN